MNPPERETERGGEGMGECRLADPGDVFEKDMPPGEQSRDGKTYDLFLTVEDLLDLTDQTLEYIDSRKYVTEDGRVGQVLLRSGFSEAFFQKGECITLTR